MGTYQWKPFTLLVSAEEVKGNEMKIEAGKYYKTRDGRKVGPIENRKREDAEHPFIWNWPDGRGNRIYKPDGTNYSDRNDDLISEWQDESPSPIRTVTRREIVPGSYGVIQVHKDGKIGMLPSVKSADQLREAAHILNQIAEVLEENGE